MRVQAFVWNDLANGSSKGGHDEVVLISFTIILWSVSFARLVGFIEGTVYSICYASEYVLRSQGCKKPDVSLEGDDKYYLKTILQTPRASGLIVNVKLTYTTYKLYFRLRVPPSTGSTFLRRYGTYVYRMLSWNYSQSKF